MTTPSASTFIFLGHQWSPEEGKAIFTYEQRHNGETFVFHETLSLPVEDQVKDIPEALLKNIFDNLLLVLGVSYYKLFCSKEIVVEGITLSREQADFWNTVYTKGLGELFYQNKIDFHDLIAFPVSASGSSAVAFPRQDRSLVGIGGGKDSIVAAELLKSQQKAFSSFLLQSSALQEDIVGILGGEQLVVKRQLDPQLFTLNKREAVFNGHIPISAIYAFVGLSAAMLYDYRFVVVSNEHSANYGNVLYQGMEVNHQWSKSFEFETMFQNYVKAYITPDVVYFSLLRQLTEIAIVKEFVKYPQYFAHFSSCNRNFKINGEGSATLWCGECPKCAFAYVLLAAFLSKEQVIGIFGQNLFAKENLLQTYKELLGVAAIKPFDCVGTPEEVQVAFYLAMQTHEYDTDLIMQFFTAEVLPKITAIETLQQQVFAHAPEHKIPSEFLEVLTV